MMPILHWEGTRQMGKLKTINAFVIAIGVLSGVAAAQPEKQAKIGKPFTLKSGQRASLGTLSVRVVAHHRGIERGPDGMELFPITYYTLEWQEGAEKSVNEEMIASPKGQQKLQSELFGRYTFKLEYGSNENDRDEVTLTVFKRSCLLRYTFSNQLKHPNGAIIFTENEDLCCYYSDGKNNCDPQVTRAAGAGSSSRYCVLYLRQQESNSKDCCCRYERGEALEKGCEADCKRVTSETTR